MHNDLAQRAVFLALKGNWEEAIKVNLKILQDNPEDTETLNRLARAYFEFGAIKKAKIIAQKVIKIDPINSIALKNLTRWENLKEKKDRSYKENAPFYFIEEPGKTKLVSLLCPGDKNTISSLNCGDEVNITTHTHRVSVVTQDGKYIGRLPDDLAARLKKFMDLGNSYRGFVKSADNKEIKIFLKEEKRVKKLSQVPSFPIEKKQVVEES